MNPISFYGFGCYRISNRSQSHRQALIHALSKGCNLIDTSSNYTNGESELLVGEVLKDWQGEKPFVITKAGYIQGPNLTAIEELNNYGKAKEDLVEIDEGLKHSIHPDFLEHQLSQSEERIGEGVIDCFLLHNPEYYFEMPEATAKEYLDRLEKAMVYLESVCENGRIKSWGISSNNFVLSPNDAKLTDINKVLERYKNIAGKYFKVIQFPFNMIEQGAVTNLYGEKTLLELAKDHGIKTVGNRPLNAFAENELIRLAYYDVDPKLVDPHFQKNCWDQMYQGLLVKWEEKGGTDEELRELPLLAQVKDVWTQLPSADAVNQVFLEHFFPMLTQIWGRSLDEKESEPYFGLYDLALAAALDQSNKKTQTWESGFNLNRPSGQKLQRHVCETYKTMGLDHVLVGMRNVQYVDDFLAN